MYHLWRMHGFKGDYFMYDYPAMLSLQESYCSSSNITPPTKAILPLKADLLIACFSLSEMDETEREAVLSGTEFDHFLVAYAPMWDGVNNEAYFESWGGERISSAHLRSGVYLFR